MSAGNIFLPAFLCQKNKGRAFLYELNIGGFYIRDLYLKNFFSINTVKSPIKKRRFTFFITTIKEHFYSINIVPFNACFRFLLSTTMPVSLNGSQFFAPIKSKQTS
jgi:hypothetical protein